MPKLTQVPGKQSWCLLFLPGFACISEWKPVYLCTACCVSLNPIICVQREREKKRQITWHISDSLFYLNNGRTVYRLGDCAASSSSIMVCPVCLVGLLFDWIMIRWAVTRNIDEQRNVSVSTYTSNYLSTLWAHWWTVTVCLNKCGFSKISDRRSDEITWNVMLWVSTCWMWRLVQKPEDLLAHPSICPQMNPDESKCFK